MVFTQSQNEDQRIAGERIVGLNFQMSILNVAHRSLTLYSSFILRARVYNSCTAVGHWLLSRKSEAKADLAMRGHMVARRPASRIFAKLWPRQTTNCYVTKFFIISLL